MGEAIARELAARGCRIGLVARRYELLQKIAGELNAGSANIIQVYEHDVTKSSQAEPLFSQIVRDLDGVDLVVYAAGIMPKIDPTEYDTEKDKQIVDTNLIGAIAWLNVAAKRFERAQEGTIIGISSPAGDRGRRGNPAYGASKAGLDAHLESLRNRLGNRHVSVVTAKPGPVRTPMTDHLGAIRGSISAERAAQLILSGARGFGRTFYVPSKWWLASRILRMIPSPIFRRLKI